MEEIITKENCNELIKKEPLSGDINSQAAAWSVVYNFCIQNGMDLSVRLTGIERVIDFLSQKIKNNP